MEKILLGEVGAAPFLHSVCDIKPGASNGHLNLHELQNERGRLGPKELEVHLLLTDEHYLF